MEGKGLQTCWRSQAAQANCTAMQNVTRAEKPRSVSLAVLLVWVSIAVDALTTLLGNDGLTADTLLFNGAVLAVYAVVNIKIAGRNNWARLAYSVLVACEVSLLLAFGLEGASDLDVLVTSFTLPLEAWSLVMLFGASADKWFAASAADRVDR